MLTSQSANNRPDIGVSELLHLQRQCSVESKNASVQSQGACWGSSHGWNAFNKHSFVSLHSGLIKPETLHTSVEH